MKKRTKPAKECMGDMGCGWAYEEWSEGTKMQNGYRTVIEGHFHIWSKDFNSCPVCGRKAGEE